MTTALPPSWKRRGLRWFANLWGPYLLSGVQVTRVASDFSAIDVELRLRPWNRNYVGVHFGGSLYAMADPWFMVMLTELLGPDYVVWDKAAAIRFRRPGRGTVRARFEVPPARVDEIRRAVDAEGKVEPVFTARLEDATGELVAEVEKVLWVRRRR